MTESPAKTGFALDCVQLSDLGLRRTNNQDAVATVIAGDEARWRSRGHFLMVADGMGAHAAGELASKLAVDNIPHIYMKLRDQSPPAALRQAFRETNELINDKGQSSFDFQGMGTTCSCLVLLPEGALVAHVGDSRVYRLRGQELVQLTFDHSLVWEMAAAGQMEQEAVPAYIPKNVITRSLGPRPTINVDLEGPFDVEAGDVFLLCSDGLSGPLTDKEIGAMLRCLPTQEAAQTLVDLANLRGGPDNISVIIGRIVGTGETDGEHKSGTDQSNGVPPRRIHPGIWLGSVLCLVGLVASRMLSFSPGMVLSGIGLGAMLAFALVQRLNHRGVVRHTLLGGPYGNGPYRSFVVMANHEVVQALAEIVRQLRVLEANPEIKIDWEPLRQHAERAAAAGDHPCTAITEYAAGIRETMRQLRQRRGPGDTTPVLGLPST